MANSVRKARNNRTSGVSKPTPGVVSNNETQRRDELANAYRQLGGTGNTDRMTIPTLEKNFTNLYEQNQANNSPVNVLTSSNPLTAIKNYRDNYNAQQAASSLYNDIKNSQTERTLARTGQTQAARQGRNALVDQVSDSVVGMLTGTANFGSQKQNLTTEMKDAGITESDLRRYNNQKNNVEREETMRNLATSHPVLSTLGAVPSNLMESTDNNLKQLLNFVQGKPLEENRSNADIIRQTVGQNINIDSPEFLERLGLTDEKATNLGRLGYSGLNSIGDMALSGLVGGGGKLAAGLMGLEKSSETMNDAIRRGLTPEQILAEGGLSGISTALTERLPFERFSNGGHVLGSMLAEGLQEGSEDILDTIFDEIVTRVGGNKDKSALHSEYNEYINAGYSPEDALNAVASNYKQQLITDTVLGGITGGLMGMGSNYVSGRNMITGKPRTQTETKSDIPTVNAVEDIPENIPTVSEGRVNPTVQNSEQQNIPTVNKTQTAQPEVKQNVPSLDSVIQRAESAVNTFLNGFNSNVLGIEEANDLRNELVSLGRQNPDAQGQINNLWQNVVSTVQGNQAQNVEQQTTPFRANPENVVYHAGTFSRLNKAESNGRFSGSNRGTGYFGTGHYFVDNNTLNELQQGGYQDKPLTSVDISGYNNLFRADTDEKANNLHRFLEDMTKYTQGSDRVSMEELYSEYAKAFDGEGNVMPYEDFVNRINELKEYMGNSDMNDRGDSVSTQFMKSLGYGGVDTRGTRFADTRYGTVIYDVDENSVLQGNVPANQRATTDMLARSDNRNVYDADEDARIQSILDEQAKNKQLEARVNELYDTSEITQNEEKLKQLYKDRTEVQSIIYDLSNTLKDVEGYVRQTERELIDLGFDPRSEEDIASEVERTTTSFSNSLAERQAELTSIEEQIASLEKANEALYREYQNAWNQAREELEQAEKDSELGENIADIKTLEDAENVIMPEVEKIDKLLRYDIQFLSGENEEESIPTLKDNGVHTGIYKTSDFATNTFPRSQTMTEEEYDSVIPESIRQTERVTHEATLNKAEENVKKNGYSGEYDRLLKDDNWDAVDVDTAMLCAMRNAESARSAEAAGVDPTEAWNREVELFKKIRSQATAGGQMIEAFKKWSAMTPEGKLGQAIAFINETVTEDKNDLRLKKEAQTAADRLLSDEFMAEFLKKAHQYDGQDVSAAKQARLEIELAHMVNEQIPVKFRQKFTSLWMDNLLASFRTLISRNFGGNIGKAALDQTLVKAISKPIDKFIARYTGTRTTTGLTKEGLKTYAKGFKKGAKQTIRDYWNPNYDPDTDAKLKDLAKEIEVFADANVTNRAGVDENNFKETIKNNRTTFKNKALKLYDKCIKFGLAFGDNPFYQGAYDQTLYELNTLREEGKLKLPEDITDTEFETWAKTVATAQGLEAVYQDNSELAEGAMDVKKGLAKMSKGYVGVDILSGASMPFVRTPMNVVKSNLELSPLGIVKNALTTIKEIRSNLESGRSAFDSESFNQRRFVRETSRNAVGTLMFIVGLMLKNAGLLTGGYSDDPREKQAQKDAGMQEYALVSPFTGNQWSINWIPGIGSAFTSASAFDDAYNKPDQDTIDAIANGVKAGSQSMFEQAALQGLQRLTGSANYSSDNKLVDNVAETIANTASSAILPSFVRQTAAALDPYKRNTYGMGGKESVINNAIAGIPFLRQQLLEPRIGLNGQPIEQNAGRNGLEKWFDNLVNPAMVTVPSTMADPVRDEASRLYEATKDSNAFQPKISLSYLKVDGHEPTTEEYTEFLQIADTTMNQIASDFIQSDFYSGLTDEEKVAALNNIYGAVQRVERARYLGIDKDFDSVDKAYAEGGADGLINYMVAKSYLNQMGSQNNPDNREAVIEMVQNGEMEQTLALSNELQQAGLQGNLNETYKYEHASQYIPSLTPTDFAQTFTAIDQQPQGTSGHGSISQGEILDYLNQNPSAYSDEDAMQLWNAYGTGSWVYIPVLNDDGTWHKKKA
jgi:hypothetical protein